MSDGDYFTCPTCGTRAEFIITCEACGHVYGPWCLIQYADPNRLDVPEKLLTSCPTCGKGSMLIHKEVDEE